MTEVRSFVGKIFLYNDVADSLRNKSGGSNWRITSRRTEQDDTVEPLKHKIEKVISQEQKRKRKRCFVDDASKRSRLLPNLSDCVLKRKIYDDDDYNNNSIKRARVTESRKRKAT